MQHAKLLSETQRAVWKHEDETLSILSNKFSKKEFEELELRIC
jgi:hypothetical protein